VELINHKANQASTHPQFLMDFGQIGIGELGCDESNDSNCDDICTENFDQCENCYKNVWKEACMNPSTAHLYKGCHR
jgi:hypothetical protein